MRLSMFLYKISVRQVWNSGLLSIKFLCVTLWHMSIFARQHFAHWHCAQPHKKGSLQGSFFCSFGVFCACPRRFLAVLCCFLPCSRRLAYCFQRRKPCVLSLSSTSCAPPSTMLTELTRVSFAFSRSSAISSAPQLHMVERILASVISRLWCRLPA